VARKKHGARKKSLASRRAIFNVVNVLDSLPVLMRAIKKIAVVLYVAALFCLQIAIPAQSIPNQRLTGHLPSGIAGLTPVGRLEAAHQLQLSIGLPLRNKEGLTNLLQRIYDPSSPDFHHYLTPAQFTEKFGPTEEDYRQVTAFANAYGLKVTATHPNRTLLDVVGSVSNIESALHVTMKTYPHPRENRMFYAPDVEPSLNLAAGVLHINGLDNFREAHPMSLKKTPQIDFTSFVSANGAGPNGTYIGNDFRAAYLPGLDLTGAGQIVGMLEFDGYYTNDISTYASLAGLAAVPLTNVYLDGFSGAAGANNLEVALDIEMAMSMAPGLSSVMVYEGKTPNDILNRMATDDLAHQLGSSWSYPIDASTEQVFLQFAAQGQSFFNASGDYDAWVGEIPPPCDDPNITIVGGTTLTTSGPGGDWVSETVWNWDIEFGPDYNGEGSGGGISLRYNIPSWQLGVNMDTNHGSASLRNLPDVALTADNIFVVADNGQEENVGGTSCSTQLWAAFAALVNEQAAVNGRQPLGFLNPAIYAIGLGSNYASCFHDVIVGNNTWSESPTLFDAVTGFDLCTGWGTPSGSNLVNFLAPDSLQILPPGNFSASGGVGGPFVPSTQFCVLTNEGASSVNWAVGTDAPWINVTPTGGSLTTNGTSTAVALSLNAAASNLFLGTYTATIWFTNLTDGVVQNRSFTLTIIKPPVILAEPADFTTIEGSTATFMASTAGGLPLNFQWQSNGINMTDGARVLGSQFTLTDTGNIYDSFTTTLTISNVCANDGATYTLVASNAAGEVVSSGAILTVAPSGPVIVQQPVGQIVLLGATVNLGVAVEGSGPFTYQWQQDGTNMSDGGAVSGSTTPALTIRGANSASIGTYSVVVSNALGISTSTGAVLTVLVATPGALLVQNGGFETGDFNFWNENGNTAGASVSTNSRAVYSGTYGALLGAKGSLGYLSQSLPTVPGQTYLLSMWLDSPDGISPNEFLVDWNGTVVIDQTNLVAFGWTNLQFFVTATDTNTLLQFGFRDDESFLGLDNIQVTPLVSADGPPIIATQPANQIALQGGTATFSVVSAGALPLSYQWQAYGVNLAGATNATLTLSNLGETQGGVFNVVVSNSLGSVTSSNAVLTVVSGMNESLTFDDLPYRFLQVPAGYGNLTWSNFYYLNGVVTRPSGYVAGMVSLPKVVYNNGGAPAAISAASPFALFSAYLTAAWNDNLQVEAQGYYGSNLVYDRTYTLSATNPTLIPFNYLGVTSVRFISSGGTPHTGYAGGGIEFVMDNVSAYVEPIPPPPPPLPLNVLSYFEGFNGGNPFSALVLGADGNFYGTTQYGGTNGYGTIFSLTVSGTLTNLVSMDSSNAYPHAGLIQGTDGNFYGTSGYGGTNDNGTIFCLSTNGTLSTLASFNESVTGAYPSTALVQGIDGNFYGTTSQGGADGEGTIFKMTPDGELTNLVSFNNSNGAYPYGALAQGTDNSFYGTTFYGGAYGAGTVFRITTNGALTTLFSFNGLNGYPYATLVQGMDGSFYGTTEYGGTNGDGSVFSVTTNGEFLNLASLNYDVSGGYPTAALVQGTDGNFYGATSSGGTFGTTYYGGTYGGGTIFRLTTNGTLTTLLSFSNTNGLSPEGGLVEGVDGNFYGTASYGGLGFNGYYNSGDGVVYRLGAGPVAAPPTIVGQPAGPIVPAGGSIILRVEAGGTGPLSYTWERNGQALAGATQSSYVTNHVSVADSGSQFRCVVSNAYGWAASANAIVSVFNGSGPLAALTGAGGGYPAGTLIQGPDGLFRGTSEYGGLYGNGTIFSVGSNGEYSVVASFDYYETGGNPYGGLLLGADGNFYGTTTYGGLHDDGTVYKLATNGALSAVHSFNGADGAEPYGQLIQGADGTFYGTTEAGGLYGYGTIFSLGTNGTVTTLVSFDDLNGAYPQSGLMEGADGSFYGTTSEGGTNGYGTVFSLGTNAMLTTLWSFANVDGAYPQASLIQGWDGRLYGVTTEGGANGDGTLFSLSTHGLLTNLFSFDGVHGLFPQGGLVQGVDGNFYGTTEAGGAYGLGTVFSLNTNGLLTNLYSFEGANGSSPAAGLIQGWDGSFYGTTTSGGLGYDGLAGSGNGTVFRLAGGGVPQAPVIESQPISQVVPAGSSVTFSVSAASAAPLTYAWQRQGAALAGATQSSYVTNNVSLADSGAVFSCLVSNAYGVTTSSNASLTVVAGTPGLITFDDLSGTGLAVPAGYEQLTWSNFYYLNGTDYGQPSGFAAGVVSTNNVAFNNQGGPAVMSEAAPFTLLSAYLTAAWNDNLQVEAQGYSGTNLIFDRTCTLNATNPTLIEFNYPGITSVQFLSSGGVPHSGYTGSGTEFVLDNVSVILPVQSPPPAPPAPLPMAVLYTFGGLDGGDPGAALVEGADGNFYGTTQYGGTNGEGTVFSLSTNGALTTLCSFDGGHGAQPSGPLVQGAGGNFYGTTEAGGAYGYGTVFSLTDAGAVRTLDSLNNFQGGLSTLVSFDSLHGAYPSGALAQGADGNLYGTTSEGGTNGEGTVFSLSTNGALNTLFTFDGVHGSYPYGGLVQGSDGNFYGTTEYGGTNDEGTVFMMTPDGTLTNLFSFDGVHGSYPYGGLVQGSDGNFYGTTEYGGTNGEGTVFMITPNGTLATLVSFDNINGAKPYGALVEGLDGNFYGTTEYGGSNDQGTVFGLTTNGAVASLFSFGGVNGLSPEGGLVEGVDGNFYGTASYGGLGFNGYYNSGDGVVYRLGAGPVAAPPTIVGQPAGPIVPAGGSIILRVEAGGTGPLSYTWERNGQALAGATQSSYVTNHVSVADSGSQFRCVVSNAYGWAASANAIVSVFNGSGPLAALTGAGGGYPAGTLIQGPDGLFRGTSEYGGLYGNGTIFSVGSNGEYSVVASFDYYETGGNPYGGLLLGADGNFYGTTTYGGLHDDGTVYKLATNGALSAVHSFNGADGAEPYGQLIQGADGTFYGTTEAGGLYGYGTIFSLGTNGTVTTLVSFDDLNGAYPQSGLMEGADGSFYGTTSEGGTNGYGTVFSLGTNAMLTTLWSFANVDGAYPQASLIQGWDGRLYGVTTEGGANGDGTLFSLSTHGLLTNLFSFDGVHGLFPQGGLVQGVDGNFYGTTEAGGAYGLGTVFSLNTNGLLTNLYSFEGANGSSPAAGLIQGWDGSFYGTTTSGGLGYDGLAGSGNGTVFRLAGGGVPQAPVIESQPISQVVPAGSSVTFSVSAASAAPLTYAWQRQGAALAGATQSSYVTNNVSLADSGAVFSCLVSNAYGVTTSSNASLTVGPGSIVQNGGFELGTFADWSASGNFADCFVGSTAQCVHSGEYGAELGPIGSPGYISQTLVTTVGGLYQISCWLNCDGQIPNEFSVSWNGNMVFDQKNIGSASWTNLQFNASATTTNTVLTFGFRDDPGYFGLDDIAVYPMGAAPPQFQNATLAAGRVSFSWSVVSGQTCQVQYATDLTQTWINLGGTITATNAVVTVSVPISTNSQLFYRCILQP
jgi:uncharacterized repeat protein (TIGR03803 family)